MSPLSKPLRIVGHVALWLLKAMLVLVFVRAGVDKFSATSGWAVGFAQWGYPPGFRVAVVVAEVGGAALLLIPPLARYGATLLAAIMLGGMYTHVAHSQPRAVSHEMMPLLLCIIVLIAQPPALI